MRSRIAVLLVLTVSATALIAQQMPRGDEVRGKALYEASRCADCHRLGETGSRVGPDLSAVGDTRTPEQLSRAIVAPDEEVLPENRSRPGAVEGRDGRDRQAPQPGCVQHPADER